MTGLRVQDEMVSRAAEAAWQAWPSDAEEPSWGALQEAMRPALEAATPTRNVVEPETVARNRREGEGGYTFNAFPPDDYEGPVLVVACVRLGDHAHLDVGSGGQVVSGDTRPRLRYGSAGKLILRWPEWELLRDLLDAAPWARVAEVERPTRGQLAERQMGMAAELQRANAQEGHLGLCATGKRVYWSERLAQRAASKARTRGELPPLRCYACPDCGHWHLSRIERPERGGEERRR